MIIDITKSYLRNIQEGDIIYAIGDNIQYRVSNVDTDEGRTILMFEEGEGYEALKYNSYEDFEDATLDEREYKIFREIIFE